MQKLPEAAKAAEKAAEALEKGDLQKALENQQKALEQLKMAAEKAMEGGMILPERRTEPGFTWSGLAYFGAVPWVASKIAWPVR